MLALAFPVVLEELTTKKGCRWANTFLNGLTEMGVIKFAQLGAIVEGIDGNQFEIKEYKTPIIWTALDDRKQTTENQRISFVKSITENAIYAHEDGLAEWIWKDPQKKYVVSQQYHHWLAPVMTLNDTTSYFTMLHTAIVPIPRTPLAQT